MKDAFTIKDINKLKKALKRAGAIPVSKKFFVPIVITSPPERKE